MGKSDQRKSELPVAETPPEQSIDMIAAEKLKVVPVYRQCPLCHGGLGGVGNCYSTHGQKRYYKCNKCGHTWTANILPVEVVNVQSRPIELSER